MNQTDENISRNHRKKEPHLVFQPEMNGDQPIQWKDLARTRVEFNSVQPIFRDKYPGLAWRMEIAKGKCSVSFCDFLSVAAAALNVSREMMAFPVYRFVPSTLQKMYTAFTFLIEMGMPNTPTTSYPNAITELQKWSEKYVDGYSVTLTFNGCMNLEAYQIVGDRSITLPQNTTWASVIGFGVLTLDKNYSLAHYAHIISLMIPA